MPTEADIYTNEIDSEFAAPVETFATPEVEPVETERLSATAQEEEPAEVEVTLEPERQIVMDAKGGEPDAWEKEGSGSGEYFLQDGQVIGPEGRTLAEIIEEQYGPELGMVYREIEQQFAEGGARVFFLPDHEERDENGTTLHTMFYVLREDGSVGWEWWSTHTPLSQEEAASFGDVLLEASDSPPLISLEHENVQGATRASLEDLSLQQEAKNTREEGTEFSVEMTESASTREEPSLPTFQIFEPVRKEGPTAPTSEIFAHLPVFEPTTAYAEIARDARPYVHEKEFTEGETRQRSVSEQSEQKAVADSSEPTKTERPTEVVYTVLQELLSIPDSDKVGVVQSEPALTEKNGPGVRVAVEPASMRIETAEQVLSVPVSSLETEKVELSAQVIPEGVRTHTNSEHSSEKELLQEQQETRAVRDAHAERSAPAMSIRDERYTNESFHGAREYHTQKEAGVPTHEWHGQVERTMQNSSSPESPQFSMRRSAGFPYEELLGSTTKISAPHANDTAPRSSRHQMNGITLRIAA